MTIIPIRGHHENWRSLMGEIMEDDGVAKVIVLTIDKQGTMRHGWFGVTVADLAFGSVVRADQALNGR